MVVVLCAALGVAGCQPEERGAVNEETRFVTQMVTVEETSPSGNGATGGGGATGETSASQEEQSPEEVLTLQYEYINGGNFEAAYALFAERSRREVSPGQYRAFFEANAPYSVTDYSFPSVDTQGDTTTVDAAFTVTSAAGVERLQRTQQLVRENEEWRVVMRPEQVEIFTATDAEPADEEAAEAEAKVERKSGQKKTKSSSSKEDPATTTVTVEVIGPDGETFSGSYGNLGSQRSVDGPVPTEYAVEVETGFPSLDSVTAVMQKRSPGPWELTVRFVVDGEVQKEQSTTAEFGVVSLNYNP